MADEQDDSTTVTDFNPGTLATRCAFVLPTCWPTCLTSRWPAKRKHWRALHCDAQGLHVMQVCSWLRSCCSDCAFVVHTSAKAADVSSPRSTANRPAQDAACPKSTQRDPVLLYRRKLLSACSSACRWHVHTWSAQMSGDRRSGQAALPTCLALSTSGRCTHDVLHVFVVI